MPPDTMSPKVCEYYVSHGLCSDYPDWSIAAPGTDVHVKIGYDYGCMVTGEWRSSQEEQDLLDEDRLNREDACDPHDDTSGSTLTTSATAMQELGLDTVDAPDEDENVSVLGIPLRNVPPPVDNSPPPNCLDQ